MAVNRTLSAVLTTRLETNYKNTQVLLNPSRLLDNLIVDISQSLSNGSGLNKADLQWYDRRQLINATEVLALDGTLQNNWGDFLDFDAIKILIIHNREQDISPLKLLEVQFKNERYYIGPNGKRIIVEPGPGGILSIVSSASQEEGSIVISSNADITYDIVLIGSRNESSSAP